MIAVVVLTFAAPDGMLADCLRSLRRHAADARPDELRVIVVDNGDAARQLPADVLTDVEVVETGTNLGYAGGMNVGIARALTAGARCIVLLNDDVVVQPGWLPPLLTELERDPAVGAVQPKLVYPGRPRRINSLGVQLGRDGAGTDIGMGELDDEGDVEARDIQLFTGGAVLLRSEFVQQVGAFDERFFLYYEDVDLGFRGSQMGWRYRCAPASRIEHRGSATASNAGQRTIFLRERNRLWILFAYRPAGDVVRGVWLSIRRLRFAPRRVHFSAICAGCAAAPRLLMRRRALSRT
ncbi:MAG: glycosyltransferase [Ilumatobacteraceae bacterium]|nr:glycosyltransferase [Ilumatobacteraceae bacterium]